MTFLGLDQESHHLLGRADPRKQPGWCFLNLCRAEAVPTPLRRRTLESSPRMSGVGTQPCSPTPEELCFVLFPTLESPF